MGTLGYSWAPAYISEKSLGSQLWIDQDHLFGLMMIQVQDSQSLCPLAGLLSPHQQEVRGRVGWWRPVVVELDMASE